MDALVSRILPLFSRTSPHGREPARLRRSGPGDGLSESPEGVLMDQRAPMPANARASAPPLSPSSLRFGVGARAMAVLTRAAPTPRTLWSALRCSAGRSLVEAR